MGTVAGMEEIGGIEFWGEERHQAVRRARFRCSPLSSLGACGDGESVFLAVMRRGAEPVEGKRDDLFDLPCPVVWWGKTEAWQF